MTSLRPEALPDSTPTSAASTPCHHHDPPPSPPPRWHHDDHLVTSTAANAVRLMCSFGGRIVPRPHDHHLRYVGGDTRIVSVPHPISFPSLLSKLSAAAGATLTHSPPLLKYQLPNEDLDSLISITSDEDVDNMLDEYDRLSSSASTAGGRTPRLRLFLFSASSTTLDLVADAPRHDQWFVDALNGGVGDVEHGRSEASSMVSEVPDYLFGLDASSDIEPSSSKFKNQTSSEPGSPFSTSLGPTVAGSKIRPSDGLVEPMGPFVMNPSWSYVPESMPIYYVNAVQPMPMPVQYMQPVGSVPLSGSYVPVGFESQFSSLGGTPANGGPVYLASAPIGHATTTSAVAYDYRLLFPAATGIPMATGEATNYFSVDKVTDKSLDL